MLSGRYRAQPAAARDRGAAGRWEWVDEGAPHLLEADRFRICAEALTAHEDVVLPDDAGLAGADPAARHERAAVQSANESCCNTPETLDNQQLARNKRDG